MSYVPPLGHTNYIQSFLPSGTYFRRISFLEVKTLDDLNSPKLGINNLEKKCESCYKDSRTCGGHLGHLELPIPTFRIFFIPQLIRILNCICFYCQKLRLPQSDPAYKWIRLLPAEHRLKHVEQFCRSYKFCGQVGDEKWQHKTPEERADQQDEIDATKSALLAQGGCCMKPYFLFKNEDRDAAFIQVIIPMHSSDHIHYTRNPQWKPVSIGPVDIFNALSLLDNETKHMLGCVPIEDAQIRKSFGMDYWNDPVNMMYTVISVPSINTRPAHTVDGVGNTKRPNVNDWTKFLRFIVQARNALQDCMKMDDSTPVIRNTYCFNKVESRDFRKCFQFGYLKKAKEREDKTKQLRKEEKSIPEGPVEKGWRNLHRQIAAFQSHSHKKYMNKGSSYGKPPTNIEERFMFQRKGQLRGYVNARRVNRCIRGVLDGDIYIRPNEVGIPQKACMKVGRRVYVSDLNRKYLQRCIVNGCDTFPGAISLRYKSGKHIWLQWYENRRDINIDDVYYVERHLNNGDNVMVSRQPILHRLSIMGYKVRVIQGDSIRLHYAVFHGKGADCDGDEVNVYVVQDQRAMAEIDNLCAVEQNITKDGKVWIKFIQNPVISAYILTGNIYLGENEMNLMVGDALPQVMALPPPAIYKPRKLWTGHQLVSMIFDKSFNVVTQEEPWKPTKHGICIRHGQLLYGRLDDTSLNKVVLKHYYADMPRKSMTLDLLYEGYRLLQGFADRYGLSSGYYDCAIEEQQGRESEMMQSIRARLDLVDKRVKLMEQLADQYPHHDPKYGSGALEACLRDHADKVSRMSQIAVAKYHECRDYVKQENGILHMINSGAKASLNTLNRMCGMVGQISVIFNRPNDRSSHFHPHYDKMKQHAFIARNYALGMDMPGMISEAQAATEAVVRKNKGTANSGYTFRKLVTGMMGIVVDYDLRVVDNQGRVLWNHYGGDNYDPQVLFPVPIRLVKFQEWDIIRRYSLLVSLPRLIEIFTKPQRDIMIRVLKGDTKSVAGAWFQHLRYDRGLLDTVVDIEPYLDEQATLTWSQQYHDPETLVTLHGEVEDLILLRQKVVTLMSRLHESFNRQMHRSPIDFRHLFRRCEAAVPPGPKVDLTPLDYHTRLPISYGTISWQKTWW